MYRKAPLVYVTALIKTSALPKLTADQTALLEQAMIEEGFIHSARGLSQTIRFSFDLGKSKEESDAISAKGIDEEETRKGFFSEDKTTCLIIGRDGIEWRTSKYKTYLEFRRSFSGLVRTVTSCIASYASVAVEELVLNYSDVIVPLEGRRLADYFVTDSHLLPLSFFEQISDFQQAGTLSVTRITSPTQKISILLEQLPTSDGKPSKFIPNSMIEFDKNFAMPIDIQENWRIALSGRSHYALLLTQASSLVKFKLADYLIDEKDLFNDVHELTSETFKGLLNHDVCDSDWQRVDVTVNK